MPKGLPNDLGKWMAQVEKRLDNLSSGNRLDHASLDGTTLYLKGDGQLGRIGRQPDGSNGVHVVKVQPPPQLTAPILTVGEQAGTCLVEWDGNTFDGRRMPLIHGHTEIWAELVGEGWSPTVAPGDTAKRVGTIRDRTGGEVVVALPQAGTWAVWLRAMGADRETAGPWSPVATVEIVPLVDTEAIEQELEEARDRLEQAEQDLAAGMADRVAEIEYLRETRIPALQDALTTGLDDVYRDAQAYAEAQADDAVNRAAADAQTEYDRLQEIAERALSRAGDNVLEDPSFETDYWFDMSWSNGYEASVSSLSRTGDRALELTRTAGGTLAYNVYFDTVDVEPDEAYRFSVWYRTTGTPDFDASAWSTRLQIRDQDNTTVIYGTTFEVTEDYTRAVVTYQVPEGVTQLRPNLLMTWRDTSSSLIIDDIAFQEVGAAAEALRLAEVARQQAEAAHVAAGEAADNAADAYAAVAGKSTIHWSLSAPSGTADNGDVWWQYELRSGRRTVVGEWVRESGAWRETDIAEERIPLLDIGTATYGTMSGDRLEAHTVRTNHLLVGPRNIITDPEFDTLGVGSDGDGWGNFNGGWEHVTTSWGTPYRGFASIADASDTSTSILHYGGSGPVSASIPCTPGEVYKLRFQVLRYVGGSSDDDYRARFRWADADGSGVAWSSSSFASVGNEGWHEFEVTAPEGAAWFYIQFYKSGSVGASRGVGNVSLEKMADSSLIVRGAVKAEHVDAADLTAGQAFLDHAMVNLIQGRMANFDQALIGGALLKDNSIATRHLVVADATNFAPEPGEYRAAWSLVRARVVANAAAYEGAAIALDNTATDNSQVRGPLLAVYPGDTIYVGAQIGWVGSAPTSGSVSLRMEWFEDANSSRENFSTAATTTDASLWLEGTVTVPDYATHARFYIYATATSGNPGTRRIRSTKVRVQTGGELIVDGAITANHIVAESVAGAVAQFITLEAENVIATLLQASNAEFQDVVARVATLIELNASRITTGQLSAARMDIASLFADSAFINSLAARVIETLQVTAERGFIGGALLEDSTITVEKLYALDEIMSELGRFLKIEAGSLASNDIEAMRIVSSLIEATTYLIHNADGDVSVRLDGLDNYIAGRLHAGMSEQAGISLDYHQAEIPDDWGDEDDEESEGGTSQFVTPEAEFHSSHTHELQPKIFVNADGALAIDPGKFAGQTRRLLQVFRGVRTQRVESVRYQVQTNNANYPGGLMRDGDRMRIYGRAPDWSHPWGTFTVGQLGPYNPSSGNYRGSIGFSAPAETGTRMPTTSGRMSQGSVEAWRSCTVTVGGVTASGFYFSLVSESTSTNMWVIYNAIWQ